MRKKRLTLASTALLTTSFLVVAQADIDGAYDHAEIPRVAGSSIVHFDRSEYDRVSIPTGPYDGDGIESMESLEGEVLSLSYTFDNPDITPLQVKRNYRQALEERGFDVLYAASNDELSGGTGRLFFNNAGLFERGARSCCHFASGNRDIRYLAVRSADGTVLAGIATFNARRVDGAAVSMTVVTAEEMETAMDHRPLTADEMASGLMEDGRVAVQDILFEHDSAEILPDSADALATISGLMQERADLHLLVVGHTDNTGSYDYNVQLSMARATSVMDHLTNQHGISGDRLQAAGAGMMAPITTNLTEEGRSRNRRVELVQMAQ